MSKRPIEEIRPDFLDGKKIELLNGSTTWFDKMVNGNCTEEKVISVVPDGFGSIECEAAPWKQTSEGKERQWNLRRRLT
jgi:hypothetical protein